MYYHCKYKFNLNKCVLLLDTMVQYRILTNKTGNIMMTIAITFMFIVKLCAAIAAEGFLAMFCLWPINDKPTSKTQFVVFGIISLIFLGWFFNWYHINFSLT